MSILYQGIDMSFDPRQPFNALPPLPPATALETHAVLKACVEARANSETEIENIVTTADWLFLFDS